MISKGQERALKLIYAVEEIILLHGRSAITAKEICKRAGTSNASAIHYFFGSQDRLIGEAMRFRLEPLYRFFKMLSIKMYGEECAECLTRAIESKDPVELQIAIYKAILTMLVSTDWAVQSAYPQLGYMSVIRDYPELWRQPGDSYGLKPFIDEYEYTAGPLLVASRSLGVSSDMEILSAVRAVFLLVFDGGIVTERALASSGRPRSISDVVARAVVNTKMVLSAITHEYPDPGYEFLTGLCERALSELGPLDFVQESFNAGFLSEY